jgi:hypothetical protein
MCWVNEKKVIFVLLFFNKPKLSINFCTYTLHTIENVGHNMGLWRRNLPHFRSAKLKKYMLFCGFVFYSTGECIQRFYIHYLNTARIFFPSFSFFFVNDWLFYSFMNERIIGSVCTYIHYIIFFGREAHTCSMRNNKCFISKLKRIIDREKNVVMCHTQGETT